jgi:O-acetyl-ADP-ribose deacetylase (regulator of RNase III)
VQRIQGDLIELAQCGRFDVLVHGCNCFHTMGAGIALAVRRSFPEAYDADQATPRGPAKLGTISFARVRCAAKPLVVVNAYTQARWGRTGVLVDYDAVAACMAAVKRTFAGSRIGYPRIGAGLAGGDWTRIAAIIDAALDGEDHTLVELP